VRRPAASLAAIPLLVLGAVPGPRPGPVPEAAGGPDGSVRTVRVDPDTLLPWRFPVGERMEYSVTWGGIRLGTGSLAVEAIDTLDARATYRVGFEVEGGPPFYRVETRMASWIRPDPFRSLRFEQRQREGDYRRDRRIEMSPETRTYTRYDLKDGEWRPHPEEIGVPIPENVLDEVSYLYFARLLPLEPGVRYEFERYWKEEGNPVVVEVLRREEIRVPAGKFRTIVLRPEIRTSGIFKEGGEAELYVTDDERRIPVRVKASMAIGSGNFFLTDYESGEGGALIAPAGEGS
jgi:hypothetical protein